MGGRVVHFEVPFDDGDRARAFYSDVFGWQMQEMPEMQYTMAMTGPMGADGWPGSAKRRARSSNRLVIVRCTPPSR